MKPEIECTKCGWQGDVSELLCRKEDVKLVNDPEYDICPDCNAVNSYMEYEE